MSVQHDRDRTSLSRRRFVGVPLAAVPAAETTLVRRAGAVQEDGDDESEDGQSDEEESGDEESNDEDDGSADEDSGGGGGVEEVITGPDGELIFEPEELTVEPGTTVRWVWESDNHNVAVESQPEGAEWEGHEPIEDEGFEFEHTFEAEGTYEYVCEPHASAGMEGVISVEEGGGGGGEGGGGGPPALPDTAISLGIGTTTAMVATLALVYFFLKYGGAEEA